MRDDRRDVMPDCNIDVRTSIIFSDKLFIITVDKEIPRAIGTSYLSTFDAMCR